MVEVPHCCGRGSAMVQCHCQNHDQNGESGGRCEWGGVGTWEEPAAWHQIEALFGDISHVLCHQKDG